MQTIITAPRMCLALTASVCVPPGAAAEFIDMSERKERLVCTLAADEEGWVEVTWKLKSLKRIEFSSAPLRYDFVN